MKKTLTTNENGNCANTVLCGVIYTKTKGGFTINRFRNLEKQIDRGILEPMIYVGDVLINDKDPVEVYWDKFGRCSNWQRSDCFIDINDKYHEIALLR